MDVCVVYSLKNYFLKDNFTHLMKSEIKMRIINSTGVKVEVKGVKLTSN